MRSQRGSRLESVFVPRHGRRLPSALSLLAISACILLGALLLGVVVPPAAQAADGTITGTVTRASDGHTVGGIDVNAYASKDDYYMGNQAASTPTDGVGAYELTLPDGSYYVEFRDNRDNTNGVYATQYFSGASTIEDAVTADTSTTASAVLTLAGHITGTVTNVGGSILPTSG